MSSELDTIPTDTVVELVDPSDRAIDRIYKQAKAMQAAHQLGSALSATKMVPDIYQGKADDATAAILYGAELGLSAIQSLQSVFIVRGKPAVYSRVMVAQVISAGHFVYEVEASPTSVKWAGRRSDNGVEFTSTWTIERAKTAGFTSNKLYESMPIEMLRAKAQAEVCRNIAPDVLLGIPYSAEELRLEAQPQRVRAERARGVAALAQRVAPVVEAEPVAEEAPAPAVKAAAGMSVETRKKWTNRMFALLGEGDCPDAQDQLIVITALAGRVDADMPEHRDGITDDELKSVVNALNAASKAGGLPDLVTELLNAYVQRQAAADDAEAVAE